MTELGERNSNVEQERKRKVAIVVLGRGVGKNPSTGKLEPTGYLEKAVIKKPELGNFGPEQHPEINEPVDTQHEPRSSRIAGAKENVKAAEALIRTLSVDPRRKLDRIYFAAGRTPDMQAYAPEGWTQGMVLAKAMLQDGVKDDLQTQGVKMVFEPENVNTWDDIVATFKDAQKNGCEQVYIVTVGVHQERTELMVREAMEGMEQVYGSDKVFDVQMVPSELMLINDEEEFKTIKEGLFKKVSKSTTAEKVTRQREQRGIASMKSGTYKSQWEDGGKIAEFNKPVQEMTVEEVINFK